MTISDLIDVVFNMMILLIDKALNAPVGSITGIIVIIVFIAAVMGAGSTKK